MRKVWMIWVADPDDPYPWLGAAMDDEMTADTDRWEKEVARVRGECHRNGWEMRIQLVNIPGVSRLFEIPEEDAVEVAVQSPGVSEVGA